MHVPLALTMGDPAGIGGELTVRAWQALHRSGLCFVALDDPRRLSGVPIVEVASLDAVPGIFANALPVLPIRLAVPARAGEPDKANAKAVLELIERAASLCLSAAARGSSPTRSTNPPCMG